MCDLESTIYGFRSLGPRCKPPRWLYQGYFCLRSLKIGASWYDPYIIFCYKCLITTTSRKSTFDGFDLQRRSPIFCGLSSVFIISNDTSIDRITSICRPGLQTIICKSLSGWIYQPFWTVCSQVCTSSTSLSLPLEISRYFICGWCKLFITFHISTYVTLPPQFCWFHGYLGLYSSVSESVSWEKYEFFPSRNRKHHWNTSIRF